jgi:hypothetical protein
METTTTTATTRNKHGNAPAKSAKHGCRECGAALPAHRFVCSPCTAAMLQRELDSFAVSS